MKFEVKYLKKVVEIPKVEFLSDDGAVAVIPYNALKELVNEPECLERGVTVETRIIIREPGHYAFIATMSDNNGRKVEGFGESIPNTLETPIAQNYPGLMAYKRAYTDAAMLFFGITPADGNASRIYSDVQIAVPETKGAEPKESVVPAAEEVANAPVAEPQPAIIPVAVPETVPVVPAEVAPAEEPKVEPAPKPTRGKRGTGKAKAAAAVTPEFVEEPAEVPDASPVPVAVTNVEVPAEDIMTPVPTAAAEPDPLFDPMFMGDDFMNGFDIFAAPTTGVPTEPAPSTTGKPAEPTPVATTAMDQTPVQEAAPVAPAVQNVPAPVVPAAPAAPAPAPAPAGDIYDTTIINCGRLRGKNLSVRAAYAAEPDNLRWVAWSMNPRMPALQEVQRVCRQFLTEVCGEAAPN